MSDVTDSNLRDLCERASHEENSDRLINLLTEINRLIDEEERQKKLARFASAAGNIKE